MTSPNSSSAAARRRAVIVGEIEMGDAVVEGVAQDLERRRIVAIAAEILPQAERDHRQLQPGLAGCRYFIVS